MSGTNVIPFEPHNIYHDYSSTVNTFQNPLYDYEEVI